MKKLFLILILSLSCTGLAYADFEDGYKAYHELDFYTAFRELLPYAQQGHVVAQAYVAYMYREGKGVSKDLTKAFYWIEQAAKQGSIPAQGTVGISYLFGLGVEKNRAMAKYWIGLARKNEHELSNEVWIKYELWR